MPDQTARDAVAGSIFNATFTAEWDDCPDGYQETRAMILRDADAILAALGIPPDATTDDVRAGLAALRIAEQHGVSVWPTAHDARARGFHAYVAEADREDVAGGASPAAAVLALANKLEEQK